MRQAVVVVHGMGEQRPTQALRGFVRAAIPEREDGIAEYYFSRPDRISDKLELRTFVSPEHPFGDPPQAGGLTTYRQDQTDLYEYHWAHLMKGNALTALWPTTHKVMFGNPFARTWNLFLLLWGLAIGLGILAWLNRDQIREALTDGSGDVLAALVAVFGLTGVFALVAAVLVKLVSGWVQSSFVDVARYLDTAPGNLEARREIHSGLVELLDGLHKSKASNGRHRYERIVIVAHSLGSYIAYDAITFLWARYNMGRDETLVTDQPCLRLLERLAEENQASTELFRETQLNAWLEYQAVGNSWRVSDLTTLGSPMCIAHRLLSTTRAKMHSDLVATREIPTSPPVTEVSPPSKPPRPDAKAWFSWPPDKRENVWVLHHAAPFAITRWTNYWFPPYLVFLGDWFGGPLRDNFGDAVRDIPLSLWNNHRWKKARNWLQLVPAAPHAWYFKWHKVANSDPHGPVGILRSALELDFVGHLMKPMHEVQQQCRQEIATRWPASESDEELEGAL